MKTVLVLFILGTLATLVTSQETSGRPIWYTYRPMLQEQDTMRELGKCLKGQITCNPTQKQIKDVFQEYYVNNCRNCCIFRRNMVSEMMNGFELEGEQEAIDIRNSFPAPK